MKILILFKILKIITRLKYRELNWTELWLRFDLLKLFWKVKLELGYEGSWKDLQLKDLSEGS